MAWPSRQWSKEGSVNGSSPWSDIRLRKACFLAQICRVNYYAVLDLNVCAGVAVAGDGVAVKSNKQTISDRKLKTKMKKDCKLLH